MQNTLTKYDMDADFTYIYIYLYVIMDQSHVAGFWHGWSTYELSKSTKVSFCFEHVQQAMQRDYIGCAVTCTYLSKRM